MYSSCHSQPISHLPVDSGLVVLQNPMAELPPYAEVVSLPTVEAMLQAPELGAQLLVDDVGQTAGIIACAMEGDGQYPLLPVQEAPVEEYGAMALVTMLYPQPDSGEWSGDLRLANIPLSHHALCMSDGSDVARAEARAAIAQSTWACPAIRRLACGGILLSYDAGIASVDVLAFRDGKGHVTSLWLHPVRVEHLETRDR